MVKILKKILKFFEVKPPNFSKVLLKESLFSNNQCNNLKLKKNLQDWTFFWIKRDDLDIKKFTEIFIFQVDDAIKHKEYNFSLQLLEIYLEHIKKRNNSIVIEILLPAILKWRFLSWEKEKKYLLEKNTYKCRKYSEIFNKNNIIFNQIIADSFKNNNMLSFFVVFKRELEKQKNFLDKESLEESELKIKIKKIDDYSKGFLKSFYSIFLSEANQFSAKHPIWTGSFPEEWKVIEQNLKSNKISNIILSAFLDDFKKEIDTNNLREYNFVFSQFFKGLFPGVNQIIFLDILFFALYPWNENKIKSLVLKKNYFSRIEKEKNKLIELRLFLEKSKTEMDKSFLKKSATKDDDIEKTINLGSYLVKINFFNAKFNKEKLEKFINKLKKLDEEYRIDSFEEANRIRLIAIFKAILLNSH